jgi:DUF1009 family protein
MRGKETAMDIELVGLIAGGGKFPVYFAEGARRQNVRVCAFALKGLTSPMLEERVDKIYWLELNDLANLVTMLRENNVRHIAMAGRVPHSVLLEEGKFDAKAKLLLSLLPSKTPMAILGLIVEELKRQGIAVMDSSYFLQDYLPQKGLLTPARQLTEREEKDIEFGMPVARGLSAWDVGQTIVVKNGIVVAVEALEGTNETIRRGGLVAGDGAVVIKASRPKKEFRFDIPVVGLQTIKAMNEVKSSALAVSAGETLFFDQDQAIELAQKSGIAIIAV